jgi:hypothetical protein
MLHKWWQLLNSGVIGNFSSRAVFREIRYHCHKVDYTTYSNMTPLSEDKFVAKLVQDSSIKFAL